MAGGEMNIWWIIIKVLQEVNRSTHANAHDKCKRTKLPIKKKYSNYIKKKHSYILSEKLKVKNPMKFKLKSGIQANTKKIILV